MSANKQLVTVNVHTPRVESVTRLEGSGNLIVKLGNGVFAGTVTLITTDAEWSEVVMAVTDFQDAESAGKNDDLRQCSCGAYGDHDESHEANA